MEEEFFLTQEVFPVLQLYVFRLINKENRNKKFKSIERNLNIPLAMLFYCIKRPFCKETFSDFSFVVVLFDKQEQK